MLDSRTLRGRLTLFYATALAVSLVVFGAAALGLIDRAQRNALDAQLGTSAHAILAIAEVQHGRLAIDEADGEHLSDILGTKASAAVWQRDGTLVAATSSGTTAQLRRLALEARAPAYTNVRAADADVRAYVTPIGAGVPAGALAIWRETDPIAELDRSVAIAFAFAIPVIVGVAIVCGGAIARRALAPLDRIAGIALEIEAHDLSARLALPARNDELGRLAAIFDRMLDRLQSAFERERRFTADASHELRAPLSVIRAEADLALRRDRTPEEYRSALRSIAHDADVLEAITSDLLSDARGESADAKPAGVSLGAIAREAAASLSPIAAQRGITIDVRVDAGDAVRAAHSTLLRAVVAVVHNAIKYAHEGGTVTLEAARDNDHVELRLTDDGSGFSRSALDHAFERFWRGDEPNAPPGSGLGLAIARSNVIANGGTVTLANGPDGGAIVRMRFPVESCGTGRGAIEEAGP